MTRKELYDDAVALLRTLVRTPSFSREEEKTAGILADWLRNKLADRVVESDGIARDEKAARRGGVTESGVVMRYGNNVWIRNMHFDTEKPTILLCSHHDTVRPSSGYTRDPFDAAIEDAGGNITGSSEIRNGGARLYGLGSNDAGASVVSLTAAFRNFYERRDLNYNLILALVAEEEVSGPGGVRSILSKMGMTGIGAGKDDFAIVGEPTMQSSVPEFSGGTETRGGRADMRMAVAEKGLLVLDCVARGEAGHAARDEGDNAIYRAMEDIEWFRTYRFPRRSELFGDVKMSVTIISAGTQHNVVPAECRFTVDVRVTERYTNEEVLEIVRERVGSEVNPRSMHLRPSSISPAHPIVKAGKAIGLATFGSPTTSDQVALDIPSVKIGPGQSSRSHSADEYVELSEIEQGIDLYIELLDKIL